jgi:hypothetical protein
VRIQTLASGLGWPEGPAILADGQVPTDCAFGAAGGHAGTDPAAESGSLLAVELDTDGQLLFPGQLTLSGQVS